MCHSAAARLARKRKVDAGDTALNAKEKALDEKGLVALPESLHDELAAAVLDACGWSDRPDDQTIR